MRNLKRALSLALAAVMVLGMMVVGASAASYDDFSDKDEIVNKEAVSVLVELGVIAGKDDGTYDPTGIITRAEMAKLICTVLNGGKDPNLGNVVTYTYADTVGHWAAPYIEYCTQLGIVAGDGAGNFNPNATVTGSEAAKMLLVATGYNAQIEGYVGANWEVTTNVRANMIGLYDGLTLNPSEGLTRDAAAQMVYNDLDALVVTYKYTLGTDGSSITTYPELVETNSAGQRVTVLEDKFGAVKVEAVVTSNDVATLNDNYRSAEDAGETYLAVTKDSPSGTSGIYTVDTDKALLGQTVNAYIKYKDDRQIVTDAVVIGSPIATSDNKIVTSNDGTGLNDLLDDNKLTVNGSTEYYCNFGGTVAKDGTVSAMTRAEFDALCGITGVGITLIDNDNDKVVEYALAEQYRYGTVSKYTDDGFRIGGSVYDEDYEPEEVIGYEDVARDDFVLYVEYGGNIYVQKPETQEAVLDNYSTSKKNVTLDGTTISWSGIAGVMSSDLMNLDTHLSSGTALDNSAVWYKDIFGYVFAVGNADEDNLSYAVLLGFENQMAGDSGILGTTARAKLLLADGTIDTFTVSTIDGKKVTNCTGTAIGTTGQKEPDADNDEVGFKSDDLYSIYSYTKTESGSMKLTLKQEDVSGDNKAIDFEKGKSTITVAGDDFTVTSNTVFLYMKPNGSVARFTGKGAPTIDLSNNTVSIQANNRYEALVVFLNNVTPSNDFKDNFAYIYNFKLSEDSNGYEASAIIDGEIKTITITAALPANGSTAVGDSLIKEDWYTNENGEKVYGHFLTSPTLGSSDGLYTYAKNDDNTYVIRHVAAGNDAYDDGYVKIGTVSAVSYTNNYIRVGSKSYTVTDSTLGFYARTNKKAEAEVTVSKGDDVVLVINDDGEVVYSFVTYYAYDKDETPDAPVYDTDTSFSTPTIDALTGAITVSYTGEQPNRAAIEDQVIAAVKSDFTDATAVAVSNLDLVNGKVTVKVTRSNNATSESTYDLKFYNKTANTTVTGDLGMAGDVKYTFTSEVTVVGNTVTMETAIPEGQDVRDVYMNDVARFLGSLYRNGNATEIKYGGKTYNWSSNPTLAGSNWTVGGAAINSTPGEKNTLVAAIFGDSTKELNTSEITLTVDGVVMTINLVK